MLKCNKKIDNSASVNQLINVKKEKMRNVKKIKKLEKEHKQKYKVTLNARLDKQK